MSTPAMLARQRKLAELEKASQDNELVFDSATQEIEHLFREHAAALDLTRSEQAKEKQKAEILPEFQGYIDGYLQNPEPDPRNYIFPMLTVWAIDAGELDQAATMIAFCLENGLVLPDKFSRPVDEVFVDEITRKVTAGSSISLDNLELICASFNETNINDKVKAKFYKMVGEQYLKTDKQKTLTFYEQALVLDDRIGLTKKIADLTKELA